MATGALVGIAGAFIAYHLVLLFRTTLVIPSAAAAIGPAVALSLWGMVR
jgi:hypothetical protein